MIDILIAALHPAPQPGLDLIEIVIGLDDAAEAMAIASQIEAAQEDLADLSKRSREAVRRCTELRPSPANFVPLGF
jgi:hypothetical protein